MNLIRNLKEARTSSKIVALALALSCLIFAAPDAQAELSVTNGDFTAGAGNNVTDITDWFDFNNGTNFWENAWQTDNPDIVYDDGAMIIFSAFAADTTEDGAGQDGYIYQAIGTADGNTTMTLQFDWGMPDDATAQRSQGITITILESDGTFVPDNNTDILGQPGVTVLDQWSSGIQVFEVDEMLLDQTHDFDISAATTGTIYLRINNYDTSPDPDEAWVAMDNIIITDVVPVELSEFIIE